MEPFAGNITPRSQVFSSTHLFSCCKVYMLQLMYVIHPVQHVWIHVPVLCMAPTNIWACVSPRCWFQLCLVWHCHRMNRCGDCACSPCISACTCICAQTCIGFDSRLSKHSQASKLRHRMVSLTCVMWTHVHVKKKCMSLS